VDFDALQVSGICDEVKTRLHLYQPDDFNARYASGSAAPDAMIIVPCTIGTAGHIAAGLNDNLIHRAAGVCLKERKPLVLVVRESPLWWTAVSLPSQKPGDHHARRPSFSQPRPELVDFFVVGCSTRSGWAPPGRWGRDRRASKFITL
jgi:hypothetical protein